VFSKGRFSVNVIFHLTLEQHSRAAEAEVVLALAKEEEERVAPAEYEKDKKVSCIK
jgi:hypothetical protein